MNIIATLAAMQCLLWLAAWIARKTLAWRLYLRGIVPGKENTARIFTLEHARWAFALHMVSRWYIVIPECMYISIVLIRRAKKARKELMEKDTEKQKDQQHKAARKAKGIRPLGSTKAIVSRSGSAAVRPGGMRRGVDRGQSNDRT